MGPYGHYIKKSHHLTDKIRPHKYDQEGRFCLGVAKLESKEDGTITGKHFTVSKYTGKRIVTIDAYKNKSEMNSQE